MKGFKVFYLFIYLFLCLIQCIRRERNAWTFKAHELYTLELSFFFLEIIVCVDGW